MTFEKEKRLLVDGLHTLKDLLATHGIVTFNEQISTLSKDVKNDFNTVAVIGEFKHGKSTFINSLLGRSLLPVDVTPTTATINAVMWGEEESLSVHRSDGSVEHRRLTKEALEDYVAEKDFDPDLIDYLEVKLPLPQLKEHKVVIIDTPGVNDLNAHRSEVTYRFIPKADVVLFLLDLTTPVRHSEKKFIEDALLKEGLDRIIFLANFLDHLDDEEVGPTISYTKDRLFEIMAGHEVKLHAISALDAIDALENGDEELLMASGLPTVKKAINAELTAGHQTRNRLERYKKRADKLFEAIEKDIEQKRMLHKQSVDELNESLLFIQRNIEEKEQNENKIHLYVEDRLDEFLLMINKSLRTFSENLKEDVKEMIGTYKSPDFKDFIEAQLPNYVKKMCKRWIEEHVEQMNGLMYKLERALADGLAKEFNTRIELSMESNFLLKLDGEDFRMTADDLSNTNVLAGAIAGGAGMLMMVFGGPILLPVVSMAGYPLLQKKLMEKRLAQAKEYVLFEVDPAMDEVIHHFKDNVVRYFKQNVWLIENEAIRLFNEQLTAMKMNIENTIQNRQNTKSDIERQLGELESLKGAVDNLRGQSKMMKAGGIV